MRGISNQFRRPVNWVFAHRALIIFFLQSLLTVASVVVSFFFRWDFQISAVLRELSICIALALVIKMPIYQLFGLSHGWWRYTSLPDSIRIFKAVSISSLLLFPVAFKFWGISRGVLCIDAVLSFLFLSGIRMLTRIIRERQAQRSMTRRKSDRRAIIVGAGAAGLSLLKRLQINPQQGLDVVGMVDDDPTKQNVKFFDIPMLGFIHDLKNLCQEYSVQDVLLAIPSLNKSRLKEIVDICSDCKVSFRIIPSMREILKGGDSGFLLRSVNVEDLLGREPVKLDKSEVIKELKDRCVLVTGAGGSIGSELCRQILQLSPAKLILLERSENALFYIRRELEEKFPTAKIVSVIADICDQPRMGNVFRTHSPTVVYHAAAYKHVYLMEENAREAVKNNVFGTFLLANKAIKYGVEKFVMISTDKAVNPLSVMGYSKRLAEIVVQSLANQEKTEFVSVRFGNVLGSSGSVVEIFKKQIESGAPLTITHPEATRFFMTTPEAVELVLHAGAHGKNGEIYMLDMGKPEKITDLARRMIQLSDPEGRRGLTTKIIGLKKGEKLNEEIVWEGEYFVPSAIEKVFRLKFKATVANIQTGLQHLRILADSDDPSIEAALKEFVDQLDSPLRASPQAPAENPILAPSSEAEAYREIQTG